MATAVIFKFKNRHIFGGMLLYHRSPLSWHHLGERRSPAFPLDYTTGDCSYFTVKNHHISAMPTWPWSKFKNLL